MAVDALEGSPSRADATVRAVMLALLPAIVMKSFAFGAGVPLQIALAGAFALLTQAAIAWLRGGSVSDATRDASTILSAILFALCLPPTAPWWIALTGAVAIVGLGKHALSAGGRSVFNPAMLGFVVVLFAFPRELTQWPAPRFAPWHDSVAAVAAIFGGHSDALAQATPLAERVSLLAQGHTFHEIASDDIAFWAYAGIAAAFAAGGLWLRRRGAISLQAPLGLLAGIGIPALIAWALDISRHASPLAHWLDGGTMMAAFFIVTDPTSGAQTPRARWWFGMAVGATAWWLRERGVLADGLAVAVLLFNALVPWLERLATPRGRVA